MDKFLWYPCKFKYITIERLNEDLKELLNSNSYKKVIGVTDWGETLFIHEESVTLTQKEIDGFVYKHGLRCRWKMGSCCN